MKNLYAEFHLTQTERHHIKLAYNYAINNNINEVKVNRMMVCFDIHNKKGYVSHGAKQRLLRKNDKGERIELFDRPRHYFSWS